jgi:uncharacterized membrane protein YdjX (TVP38/TMEM64 family)
MDGLQRQDSDRTRRMSRRWIIGLTLAVSVIAVLMGLFVVKADHPVMSEAWVHGVVVQFGMAGPLAVIILMLLAIVVSPIPSGPIAVAAGALYGTVWGGTFVAIGASLGAFVAFGAARYLGFDAVRKSENSILKFIAKPRSEYSLMLVVFGSRLIPFISFDAVSYAAGLTCLTFARFALATTLGVIPVCFVLAAMGAGMADGGSNWMLIVGLGGAITFIPLIAKWIWDRMRGKSERGL